jgi:DNA modification methylase
MIINNDCLIALKEMEDNSIDSVVTDPPYGISFMNKHWDYDVPRVDVWKEVLRVLKPGGHILCACGTRTQHRMTVNIEDAGFEIRDVVAWIYGSGFPKSLNVGKAIDSFQGNEREFITTVKKKPSASSDCNEGWVRPWAEGKTTMDITKGNSEYEGWGTALKPAMELWTLARKPLEQKTVAENVLKYGTGGINVDGCRVEYLSESDKASAIPQGRITSKDEHTGVGAVVGGVNNIELDKEQWIKEKQIGRFPANVIHDGSEDVLENFPNNKGAFAPVKAGQKGFGGEIYGKYAQSGDDGETFYGDGLGSASRFFYCAKASKSERNKGCDDFEEQVTDDGREKSIDNAFLLAETMRKNNHPTVKPVSLMRYLCRMITPKNGTILDPFMGSGSTGIGAKVEGFSFIGIERETEYCKIAEARIAAWGKEEKVKEVTETITHKITRIQNETKQKTELKLF